MAKSGSVAEWELRSWVRQELEQAKGEVGVGVNVAIALLILLSAAIFVLQTYPLPPVWARTLQVLDWLIVVLFTVEYAARLWAAEQPIKYFFSLYALVDLVAIAPVLLGLFDIRYLRLVRWFRILKLARFLATEAWLGPEGIIIARIIFTLFAIVFIYSGAIYQVEHPADPTVFKTFLDAVYFAVVTMTTVGYGDVTPVSETGRTLTVLMILTGIALIPTQIGSLFQTINRMQGKVKLVCDRCGLDSHEPDALFCRRCGQQLPSPSAEQGE
ncbi:MAG: ion transporter [Cyanobacteria bacterium J06626_23]